MTLAAKGGGLSALVGIDHEVPVAPFMPVMMFAILFGLSMDYEGLPGLGDPRGVPQ